MNTATISQMITTLGLPIVLVLVMGWFIFKLWKQSAEREKRLYDEFEAGEYNKTDSFGNMYSTYYCRQRIYCQDTVRKLQ